MGRTIAVAIPARNEAANLPGCLAALAKAAAFAGCEVRVAVLANNCNDGTAEQVNPCDVPADLVVEIIEVRLPRERAHAGWARRLAFDAAAKRLASDTDLLLSTDADTLVAEDWLVRTKAHFDAGYDAVAGWARLNAREVRAFPPGHRARLAALRRYDRAIGYLKASHDMEEPWPRHFYEGGASLALTVAAYRAIGGAPTPRVGEDKALFDAVRAIGGRVRHPLDVRVQTSPRLIGRAAGGTSDTLALWGDLADDKEIFGVKTIAENLASKNADGRGLTFKDLPAEIEHARELVRLARQARALTALAS